MRIFFKLSLFNLGNCKKYICRDLYLIKVAHQKRKQYKYHFFKLRMKKNLNDTSISIYFCVIDT